MKKLFVSVPMKGRAKEEIQASILKMHKIAEVYEGEELELIDSYVQEEPPLNCNQSVWYLAKSIEKLAEADIFIGIRDTIGWPGCKIEADVAKAYDIKSYRVDNDIILSTYELVRKAITDLMANSAINYNTIEELKETQS
jgi:hypothetical protein